MNLDDDFDVLKKSLKDLLTLKSVKNLTKLSLGSEVDVEEFSVGPYSSEKLGYLSSLLRLDVKHGRGRLSFFVKVIPYDVPLQAEYVNGRGVFGNEALFYGKILPEMEKNYRGEPWAPKCFKVDEDFIVFEDLASQKPRYSMRNKLFSEDLVVSGLSALARFHAASLLAENRLGRNFDELYPEAFTEKSFQRKGSAGEWFSAGEKFAVEIAERLGLNASVVSISLEEIFHAIGKSRSKRNVVSHGDLWANNLMFSEENENPRCRLVDFQLLRYCPRGHDVAQFLFLCANRRFRRAKELEMLKIYQKTFQSILRDNDYPLEPPSWQDLLLSYEEQKISAVATAVLFFPTVLMDGKTSARVMNDPQTYEDYYFHDRTPYALEVMENDPVYRSRIEEAVEELIDLGSRIDELPKPC